MHGVIWGKVPEFLPVHSAFLKRGTIYKCSLFVKTKFLENSSEIMRWRNYLDYKLFKENFALGFWVAFVNTNTATDRLGKQDSG